MDNAWVLGHGFVGKATMKALDIPWYFSRSESNITLKEASKKQFCFICLPTETNERGGQEEARKVIHDYIQQLKGYGGRNIFVIRSTVIPGTCKALAEEFGVLIGHCPEFLSEDTWEKDAVKPRAIVIGADNIQVKNALENVWKKVPTKIRISTDTVTSEMIKYVHNMFGVTKIIFGNTIYDACQVSGANYDVIYDYLHQHPWGSKHHFKILHKGGRGAGGNCFPKDLKAFAQWSNSKFFKMLQELNTEYLRSTKKE